MYFVFRILIINLIFRLFADRVANKKFEDTNISLSPKKSSKLLNQPNSVRKVKRDDKIRILDFSNDIEGN